MRSNYVAYIFRVSVGSSNTESEENDDYIFRVSVGSSISESEENVANVGTRVQTEGCFAWGVKSKYHLFKQFHCILELERLFGACNLKSHNLK